MGGEGGWLGGGGDYVLNRFFTFCVAAVGIFYESLGFAVGMRWDLKIVVATDCHNITTIKTKSKVL